MLTECHSQFQLSIFVSRRWYRGFFNHIPTILQFATQLMQESPNYLWWKETEQGRTVTLVAMESKYR